MGLLQNIILLAIYPTFTQQKKAGMASREGVRVKMEGEEEVERKRAKASLIEGLNSGGEKRFV